MGKSLFIDRINEFLRNINFQVIKGHLFSMTIFAFSLFAILSKLVGIFTGILIFVVIMFIHEMGHFLVGLALGFKIMEFSIFLGPRLYTFRYKGIDFSLKAIPLGASVSFYGEEGQAEGSSSDPSVMPDEEHTQSDVQIQQVNPQSAQEQAQVQVQAQNPGIDQGAFYQRPPLYRAATIFAGPFINIISGYLAILFLFMASGFEIPILLTPPPNSALAEAGFRGNEKIISINDQKVNNMLDFSYVYILASQNKEKQELKIAFQDLSQTQSLPQEKNVVLKKEERARLGVSFTPDQQGGLRIVGLSPSRQQENLLRENDLLLAIDGQIISELNLQNYFSTKKIGDAVTLKISRANEELELKVPLESGIYEQELGLAFTNSHNFLSSFKAAYNYTKSVIYMTYDSLAKLVTGKLNAKESLSGPVGIVSAISSVSTSAIPLALRIRKLVLLFALISFSLGLMNLLPIAPLDGFLLVASFYELIFRHPFPKKLQMALTMLGILLILFLFLLGLYFDISRLWRGF